MTLRQRGYGERATTIPPTETAAPWADHYPRAGQAGPPACHGTREEMTVTKRISNSLIAGMVATAMLAASAGATAIAQDVTLTYLTSQGWAEDPFLALTEKFAEETGIAVDTQIVPADQYYTVLRTKLNSGEGPDIFGGQSGKSALVVELNVEKNAVDLSNEPWAGDVDPLVAEQATVDGKLYGLTYWDTLGLVWVVNYNKQVFADNGISVPTTYEEFKAASQKLLDAGVQPIYEPVADGWHHVLWFNELGPVYEAGTPGLADALNANEATFAGNELMLANLTQLKEMFDSGYLGENALADTFAEAPSKLAAGEVAMVVAPLAYAATVHNDIPESDPSNIGVFLMPLADNQIMNVNPAGPTMFIYKNSPHVAEAKQFFDWLTQPEQLQAFIDNSPNVLTLPFKSVVKTKFTPEQQAFMDAYADSRGTVYQTAVNYVNPQWMEIGKDITAMFTGAMTPEDVLESIDRRRADFAAAARDPAWQ
jgi:raffinose/stachyose/melibiose transport system substrate-binding protein